MGTEAVPTGVSATTLDQRRPRGWILIVIAVASLATSPLLVIYEFGVAVLLGLFAGILVVRHHDRSAKKYGALSLALFAGPAFYLIAWLMVLLFDNG